MKLPRPARIGIGVLVIAAAAWSALNPDSVSLQVPLADIGAHINTLSRAEPIVLVCKTDKRSAQAAAILRAEGIERVQVLRGGMEAWNAQGKPS